MELRVVPALRELEQLEVRTRAIGQRELPRTQEPHPAGQAGDLLERADVERAVAQERRGQLGRYSRTEFVLRMTRAEIGSFLGLKLETVSRVLSRFAQDGLIDVNQKHVRIVNPDGLRQIISGQGN